VARQGNQEELPFRKIPLDLLDISESNVRRQHLTADLDDLARSMDEIGLQHPIVVQSKNGRFEILIGQRRFLAARQLGWHDIYARVEEVRRTPVEAKVVSFAENIQRRDISPDDKSSACQYLLEELGSVTEVARRLNITSQTVRKWLGYAAVPERLRALVGPRGITAPMAMRLIQLVPDEDKAVAVAERILEIKAPAGHRSRIMAAIQEAPDRPIGSIFRRAGEMRHERRVTVVLPEQWALALERAAQSLNLGLGEIAREAIIEWLDLGRY